MHHKIYWTTDMETSLIDLVKDRPHLWDSRNKNYLKKNLKVEGFLQIAEALKEKWPEHAQLFTQEGIAHKFSILKSSFRREWREKVRSETEDYVPKWEHYARLSFLERVPARRRKSSGGAEVVPMDISDDSEDGTSPDSELDNGENPGSSGRNLRLKLRPILGKEEDQKSYVYQSSEDESCSEDLSPDHSPIEDVFHERERSGLSPVDYQKKHALDMAFCRYLNTMLSPVPDCLNKELARMKVTEMIMKMKFPLV